MSVKPENVAWQKLKVHRERAAKLPLDILIWGPSDDGSDEYRMRCQIKNDLIEKGHNAIFGEDLSAEKGALKNPLGDEKLQVEVADAIVVLYKSRGTQTEIDKFLEDILIAQKTYLLVSKKVLSNVRISVSSCNWEEMARYATIVEYDTIQNLGDKLNEIYNKIQELREKIYIKRL